MSSYGRWDVFAKTLCISTWFSPRPLFVRGHFWTWSPLIFRFASSFVQLFGVLDMTFSSTCRAPVQEWDANRATALNKYGTTCPIVKRNRQELQTNLWTYIVRKQWLKVVLVHIGQFWGAPRGTLPTKSRRYWALLAWVVFWAAHKTQIKTQRYTLDMSCVVPILFNSRYICFEWRCILGWFNLGALWPQLCSAPEGMSWSANRMLHNDTKICSLSHWKIMGKSLEKKPK